MVGYPVEVKEEDVTAAGVNMRISTKNARKVCGEINRKKMKLVDAIKFVEGLIDGENDIDGKTYEATAAGVLDVLKNAENNAEFKGIPTEKLRVKTISAEPGTRMMRAKRRQSFGMNMKTSHIKVVLERG